MNWLDIVIIVLLLWAVWDGAKQGFIRQLMGLAALIVGLYMAWKFGGDIGNTLGLDGLKAEIAGFAVVLVVVIVVVALIAWLTRGLFKLVGLGIFDNLLGVVFSVFKMILITGALLMLVDFVDTGDKVLSRKTKEQSPMFGFVMTVSDAVIPSAAQVRQLFND